MQHCVVTRLNEDATVTITITGQHTAKVANTRAEILRECLLSYLADTATSRSVLDEAGDPLLVCYRPALGQNLTVWMANALTVAEREALLARMPEGCSVSHNEVAP